MAKDKSYQERYGDAVGEGRTESLNVQIHRWAEEGDTLVGMFIGSEELPEGEFKTVVRAYLLRTDDGLRSAILGSAADKQILPRLQPGDLVMIEYQGKTDIGDGKRVNRFRVEKFGHETPPPTPKAPVHRKQEGDGGEAHDP